ncbi:MAG: A/G-specific adenine glycosylase [Bacteroidia bacterium]
MSSPIHNLLPWYAREGRDLPWRQTRDPYKIWLSEVILQQTRIDQGTAYYLRFIEVFPTVQDLANSDTDTLMKLWEGLGYYSRARNLNAAAKAIAFDLGGIFPTDYREWMKLKGVGPYTARAVGSMAFDNPTGVLDGNVFRVLSRYLADFSPIDLPATRNAFQAQLDKWIVSAVEQSGEALIPGRFNQAMMDLGATVCTPKRPSCSICPLHQDCQAAARGLTNELPVKSKKLQRKVSLRYYYIIGVDSGELLVRRRPPQGLWPNLWEVANHEVDVKTWAGDDPVGCKRLGEFKHVLTHIDVHVRAYAAERLPAWAEEKLEVDHIRIPLADVGRYGFSRAVLKIFERYLQPIDYFPSHELSTEDDQGIA